MIRARLVNLFLLLVLVGRALSGATAPTITTQPASQTVTLGAKATFSVVASGTALLSCQWSRNGSAITGATPASYTTATYTTLATVAGDSGASFTVKVSNSYGNVTSSAAILTVTAPVAPEVFTAAAIGGRKTLPPSPHGLLWNSTYPSLHCETRLVITSNRVSGASFGTYALKENDMNLVRSRVL